jgi:hypothetical protein
MPSHVAERTKRLARVMPLMVEFSNNLDIGAPFVGLTGGELAIWSSVNRRPFAERMCYSRFGLPAQKIPV